MSSAMEKMVAQMLGFTPEQMNETLSGLKTLANDLKQKLDKNCQMQEEILALLKGNSDGERTDCQRDGRSNAGSTN